jgi:hypothetical protein
MIALAWSTQVPKTPVEDALDQPLGFKRRSSTAWP